MRQLTTLFLYTALALCLALFGYSLWKATLGKPIQPQTEETQPTFHTPPTVQAPPADQALSAETKNPHTISLQQKPDQKEYELLPSEQKPEQQQEQRPGPQPQADNTRDNTQPPTGAIRIAIIIDDVGYSLPHGMEAAELPGALTLAVLPHSPHGVELAELGYQQGKEIMLHAPMSTVQHRKLDIGGLTADMSQQEFETTLTGNLASIPHVRGLNNHMGSELTQRSQPMQWLMTALARKNLFFIDSRTSAESVALQTAQANRVPTRKRDVFLDNIRTGEAIGRQFDTLIKLARQRGSAIAIGHPYPETLTYLSQALPELSQRGIQLVPVSRLLAGTVSQKQTTPVYTETTAVIRDL